jgi:hypothetical protein
MEKVGRCRSRLHVALLLSSLDRARGLAILTAVLGSSRGGSPAACAAGLAVCSRLREGEVRSFAVGTVLLLAVFSTGRGEELSVTDILDARQPAVPERYLFLPKQVVGVAVEKPPLLDGRLDDPCWRVAGVCGPLGLLTSAAAATDRPGEPGPSGQKEAVFDPEAQTPREPPSQQTEVRVCHAGGVLYVGFRCLESAMAQRHHPEEKEGAAADEKAPIDSLQLYFSPRNDHTRYYRLVIDTLGGTRLFVGYALRGEFPRDRMTNEQELFRGPSFACEVADEKAAWTGEVAVPASALDLEGNLTGQVWGFDVVRVRTPEPAETSAWSFAPGRTDVFPAEFGELFLGERPVGVTGVDLGQPHWGENVARVTMTNRLAGSSKVRVLAQVFLPVEEVVCDRYEEVVVLRGGETRQLAVPYRLSWRGRWPVYAEYCQRLSLRLENAQSEESKRSQTRLFYLASYPVAFDEGVKPSERYGEGRGAPDPAPRDPEFVAKKRAYVISGIPRFHRLGRQEGAESDFVLAAEDGSVRFDLMEAGAMQRIADWLFGLFDTDIDRMLGAIYFVHQRSVTCHSGFLSGMGPMTSLSVLRRGGGLCDSRAQVLGSILSLMKCEATGKPYRTHCLGLKGHVVCAVEAVPEPKGPEDHWVLDPDVGVFYFTWDNSRFVTLGELRRDRGLCYRMNFNNVRHGREFYFRTEHQFTYDPEQKVVWPPEAPAW